MDFALAAFFVAPASRLGSFLNVVAARLPERRSVVRPGSACLACATEIAWYDNVPVLSYLVLRGRCRTLRDADRAALPGRRARHRACCSRAASLAFGLTCGGRRRRLLRSRSSSSPRPTSTHRIVPNRVVLPAAAIVVLALMTLAHPSPEWAIGALGASGFLLVAALAYPGGMGMGDVKLALLMGAALGRTVPVALMLGMIAALVPVDRLCSRHGRRRRARWRSRSRPSWRSARWSPCSPATR